jgi:hypothetical protein
MSAPVAAVEQMEERTRKQQQVGKEAEEVRGVLGDHEERGDRQERQ